MLIDLQRVSKTFPGQRHQVLRDLSLTIQEGRICGIIGRSGAGKSTLMRCLNGLETIDTGSLTLFGQVRSSLTIADQRLLQRKIGTVFQTFNLLSRLTIWENVALPLEWMGLPKEERRHKAQEWLALVGLEGFAERYPASLSGGQRQRVAIARALVTGAPLLLCDEFTSALDPETTLEILELLKDLNIKLGVTIVLITHDMTVVRECCDDVVVMDHGEIVEAGDVTQLLLSPQHEVTRQLISHLFQKDLPHSLMAQIMPAPILPCMAVVRLLFSGRSAQKPVISTLTQQHGILVSIIAGQLDHLREEAFGSLVVATPYVPDAYKQMMKHFEENGVQAEIVGYVP